MSAEPSQHLERDYIRLTERFKALSTFSQFLKGIHRAFLPAPAEHVPDLGPLYGELKALSGRLEDQSPDSAREMMRDVEAKLEAAAGELREADMALSPSLTRRYFEKVRPGDDRIPFYLLRFYLTQTDTDEDLLDKVDYLVTAAAAGSGDPGTPAVRSRAEIRALFERILEGCEAAPIDVEVAPELARAFDELAAQIAGTTGFADLAGEGLIESLRTMKRRLARGMAHPEILTAVAACNLTARAVFQRLYEKEERALRASSDRIDELERRAGPLEEGVESAVRRFRDSQSALETQAAEGSVRWRQLLELHEAASEALTVLDGARADSPEELEETLAPEERPLAGDEDPFWGPCLRRIQEAADPAQAYSAAGLPYTNLEPWEIEAALRSVAGMALSKSEDVVLRATALRVKAESEVDAARSREGSEVPPDLLREARTTLSHVTEIDHVFSELAGTQGFSGVMSEDVRQWMRTRLRLLHAASALWLELDRRVS
jgi:hypothetical protein